MAGSIRKPAQRSRARFLVRPLFAALVASGIVAPAQGATIVVGDGGDAGTGSTCTLRQAIDSLNGGAVVGACVNTGAAFGTSDTVDLTLRTGTITLAGAAALPINVDTRLQGPGPAQLTISGAGASRVLELSDPANFLGVYGLTVANGKSKGPGGCIYAEPPSLVFLSNAVITGCKANDDPTFVGTPFNGFGGGVFTYALIAENTTISGNTAQTAGGGVVAGLVEMHQTLVTGNTVLGETVDVNSYGYNKYALASTAAGGGGIVAGRTAYLAYSVVSNNTVNATRFTGTKDGNNYEYRFGNGGGISQIGLKYTNPMLAPAGKSTISGARPLFPQPTASKAAEIRARAATLWTSPVAKAAALKPKADVPYQGLTLWSSTISGNRIVGGSGAPNNTEVLAKYGGGGAAFLSSDYTAHIANSTISGNLLPAGGICSPPSGPPTGNFLKATCGAGLAGDSANIANTTITGNVGATAVQFKYGITSTTLAPASAKSAILDSHPRLRDAFLRAQPSPGATPKARMKAATSSDLVSTIVGANSGDYDIGCLNNCVLTGSSNLVRTAQSTVTLPLGTLGSDPQLAPLANRGGVPAGAPGIGGTGAPQTHALYVGSPALNAGENPGAFSYDERGPGFPRTVGPATDIGAYEGSVPRPANSIPALGPWMLGALSALLGALGLWRRRRRA